jgi:preprotein translocase YajC subunit
VHSIAFIGQQQGSDQSMLPMMIMFAIVIVVMFFFMSRSRKRQEAEHKKMVESLEQGVRVLLNSGLVARVDKIDKDNQEVRLLIDEDKKVHATYSLVAIVKVFKEEVSSVKKED